MVSSLVSQFIAGLEEDGPLLQTEALSPAQMTAAARYDIERGILNTKDFPDNLDLNQVMEKFKKRYSEVIRAIRTSIESVTKNIADHAKHIPAFYPTDPVTYNTVVQMTPIVQAVDVAYIATNTAYINLRRMLAEVRGDLTRLGGGLPITIDPNITRIANMANSLEKTAVGRDAILSLFRMKAPSTRAGDGLATLQPAGEGNTDKISNAMGRLALIVTASGRQQRHNYAAAINMLIRAQYCAIEAARTYYQIGGRNIELQASIGGSDSLPRIETALLSAHETIRTSIARILRDIVGSPAFVASRGLTPAEVAQVEKLADDVNGLIINSRIKGRAARESFEDQSRQLGRIRLKANEAFAIIIG